MIGRLIDFVRSLFHQGPVRLAIVRRYEDANGNYVGELYLEQVISRKHDELKGYTMIGASLDNLELMADGKIFRGVDILDVHNDFLAPMLTPAVRVGALDPKSNDAVRQRIAQLPRRNMTIVINNGFIEAPSMGIVKTVTDSSDGHREAEGHL